MKKDKFITVMAIFDDETQERMQNIQYEFEQLYGMDTKTKGIPFHITLGSYAPEETEKIISRIISVTKQTGSFDVKFKGLSHFGNLVRFLEPDISTSLIGLHEYFDSDYANGFKGWMPHATLYRHSEPKEIELTKQIEEKINGLTNSKIIGIELGEFFPPKQIIRVLFDE